MSAPLFSFFFSFYLVQIFPSVLNCRKARDRERRVGKLLRDRFFNLSLSLSCVCVFAREEKSKGSELQKNAVHPNDRNIVQKKKKQGKKRQVSATILHSLLFPNPSSPSLPRFQPTVSPNFVIFDGTVVA